MHDFTFNTSLTSQEISVNFGMRVFLLPLLQKISKITGYKI